MTPLIIYTSHNTPMSVACSRKILYICKVVQEFLSDITYCESVFRKSLIENVVVFLSEGRYGTTLTSCRFMRMGTICTLIPHIYYDVGYCVVYLLLGLSTTFRRINGSQLHTFFVYILNDLMELQTPFDYDTENIIRISCCGDYKNPDRRYSMCK